MAHRRSLFYLLALGVLLACLSAFAAPPTVGGLAVCPRPGDRCNAPQKAFDPFELPFRLPKRLKANALYESAPFYAVALRRESDPACDGGEYSVTLERFRIATQTRFPDRKVFADHHPNMAAVGYEFVGERRTGQNSVVSFVAVYAGKSAAEGRSVLGKAKRRFPKATLHQMRVNYSRVVQ